MADAAKTPGFAVERGVAALADRLSRHQGLGRPPHRLLRRVRRAARRRATPAATTSSPLRRWAPRSDWARSPTSSTSRVTLLGTPSEEGGGGKIDLINAGYFDDAHAAMMVHPWPNERLEATLPRGRPLRRDVSPARRPTPPPRRGRASTRSTPSPSPKSRSALLRQQLRPGRPGPRHRHRRRLGREHHPESRGRTLHGALGHGERLARASRARRRLLRGGRARDGRARSTIEELGQRLLAYGVRPRDPRPLPTRGRSARTHFRARRRRRRRDPRSRPTWPTSRSSCRRSTRCSMIPTHGAVNHQPEFTAACVTPVGGPGRHRRRVALAHTAISCRPRRGAARTAAWRAHDARTRPAAASPLGERTSSKSSMGAALPIIESAPDCFGAEVRRQQKTPPSTCCSFAGASVEAHMAFREIEPLRAVARADAPLLRESAVRHPLPRAARPLGGWYTPNSVA